MSFLGSQLFGFGADLYQNFQFNQQFRDATAANERRLEEVQTIQGGLRDRVLGRTQDLSQQLTRRDDLAGQSFFRDSRDLRSGLSQGFGARTELGEQRSQGIVGGFADQVGFGAREQGNILGGERARAAFGQRGGFDLTSGFQTRRSGLLQQLQGLGAQVSRDINRDSLSFGARVNDDLTSRGLSGTTVRQSQALGVERERRASQTRLSDTLRRERIGLDQQLSADVLGSRERGLTRNLGLQGDVLRRQQFGLGQNLDLQAGFLGALQGQRNFGAGLSGDQLFSNAAAGQFDLNARAGRFQQLLQNRLGFQDRVTNLDINLSRDQAQTIENVSNPFPQRRPPIQR